MNESEDTKNEGDDNKSEKKSKSKPVLGVNGHGKGVAFQDSSNKEDNLALPTADDIDITTIEDVNKSYNWKYSPHMADTTEEKETSTKVEEKTQDGNVVVELTSTNSNTLLLKLIKLITGITPTMLTFFI